MAETKKTLWHSELKDMGPVMVTVKTEPQKSKFKDKPDYVILEIDGAERTYSCENPSCAEFFRGQKGNRFALVAEGGREDAKLTYVGETLQADDPGEAEYAPVPPKQPKAAPPATPPAGRPPPRGNEPPAQASAPPTRPPAGKAAAETPDEAVKRVRKCANKIANTWLVAQRAARFVELQLHSQFQEELTPDQFQGLVGTLAVQMFRDGLHHQMPLGVIDFGRAKEATE